MRPTGRCCRKASSKPSMRFGKEPLFRAALGDIFVDYFVALKRTEWDRYLRSGASLQSDDASAWEQNEYFDFF